MNVILLLQLLILFSYLIYLTAKMGHLFKNAVIPVGLKNYQIHKYVKTDSIIDSFFSKKEILLLVTDKNNSEEDHSFFPLK